MRSLAERTSLRTLSLFAGDTAITLWLWFARCSFAGAPFRWLPDAAGIAAAAAGLAWIAGLHRPVTGRLFVPAARTAGFALALALVVGAGGGLHGLPASPPAALWFGAAVGAVFFVFRLAHRRASLDWPDHPGEVGRWLLVGAGATALTLPYFRQGALGSGDAYWYVLMLKDFITQVRHGVFPVWVGQSEFGFNGGVYPLRIAPWFQYMGGLLDTLTARSLEPTALKNALLCVNALATGASAYFGLRCVLPRRPGIAALLSLLWLLCPGVLAPLFLGDQYMTFMAMPFLPILLTGCWRLWAFDDARARRLIAIGLAGLWLSHAPIAMWSSFLAACMYIGPLVARRHWLAEVRLLGLMAALFLALGSLPIASALTIDNPNTAPAGRIQAWEQIDRVFPDCLKPIKDGSHGLENYQLGYGLMGAGIAAMILLAWLRPRGAVAFGVAVPAIALLVLPVPGVSFWLWSHMPQLVVNINNIWPMQRLYGIWGAVIVFALGLAAADPRISGHSRRAGLLLAVLAAGGVWSATQAAKLVRDIVPTMINDAKTEEFLRPENAVLTRYSYVSFATVPEYFSHGYSDPSLENRLLDRATLAVMTTNADAAAPRLRPDSEPATVPRLVQSGVWTGTSDNHSAIYLLQPSLDPLEPGRHYALRLDFFDTEPAGVLQIVAPGLFREYLLPDSGAGLPMKGPSMAFGALPASGRVVPLMFQAPGPEAPFARFYLKRYGGEHLKFARFWLFSYDQDDLPVRVRSWIPYRAETDAAVAAYLETPRIWQRGWRAEVNGRPAAVLASPNNLAMIPVEPGTSRVSLTFHPPLWLSLLFWIHVAAWTAVVCCLGDIGLG